MSSSLLMRYLLPLQLLEPPEGDVFLQRAMRIHNAERLARWMPHYVRVHAVLLLVMMTLAGVACTAGAPTLLAAALCVPATLEFLLVTVFACCVVAVWLEPGY